MAACEAAMERCDTPVMLAGEGDGVAAGVGGGQRGPLLETNGCLKWVRVGCRCSWRELVCQ